MTPQTEGSPLSKPIDQTKAIELSASQSTFSFDIACLGYLSPEYNTVSYMLEGYDRDWQTLTNGNRHILYMNLPAGEYRLVVKGINNDGMESEPIALDIQVNRPFRLSRFMLFVYLLAALCLIAYAIRRYKRRLEAANQERMLKFSLDKEKELYEAKIGFFTNIAHEIRTPLSLISAPLDAILSSNEANQKTRSNLAIMKSNVQRLLELVNQLLDFRKVESQLMKLNVQSCRVSDVVMSICHRYEEYLRVHHLEMDTTGVQPGILCNLDQEAFVKMIGNLMSNAIKYAKKHISLTLQIRQDDNMLQFEITDDGPGIREEEQPKVFESFYQVDDHGKRPGSGLGLPLALNLAKMHGGSITLHSVYGEGSRFTLTLPMTLETQESLEEKPSTTVDETIEKASEPQDVVQVLIVEDNDELRDFVINNLDTKNLNKSIMDFAEEVKKSQIIFIPGGFSGGDEPDGSAKFITSFFRNEAIKNAVTDLLDKREGLMLGICNGFQALIKLGLVPYGKIMDTDQTCPTLTFNTIARHQSKIVRTRIASNKSPWLARTKVGDVYNVAISHGEGRFYASEELVRELAKNGQIATQYVNLKGEATDDIRYNPNNSALAVEGITSFDGRVLGKMGHSERIGNGLYKNVYGEYDMEMFKSAVMFFK